MQFALVGNQRTSPSPGLTGSCPVCGGAMIAKCGTQRVHHWAHRGERACDAWWEPETPWHRDWKSRFPADWREVIRFSQSGEKHIADVRTEHGLTIEFQHSHLKPDERAAREAFYGNMMWVVDGARLVRDLPRFLGGSSSFRKTTKKGLYIVPFPDEVFPRSWLDCAVPVVFDFGNAIGPESARHVRRPLWCLLPGRALGQAVVLQLSRGSFVNWTHARAQPIPVREMLEGVACALLERERRMQLETLRAASFTVRQHQGWRRQSYRRRYARF